MSLVPSSFNSFIIRGGYRPWYPWVHRDCSTTPIMRVVLLERWIQGYDKAGHFAIPIESQIWWTRQVMKLHE